MDKSYMEKANWLTGEQLKLFLNMSAVLADLTKNRGFGFVHIYLDSLKLATSLKIHIDKVNTMFLTDKNITYKYLMPLLSHSETEELRELIRKRSKNKSLIEKCDNIDLVYDFDAETADKHIEKVDGDNERPRAFTASIYTRFKESFKHLRRSNRH